MGKMYIIDELNMRVLDIRPNTGITPLNEWRNFKPHLKIGWAQTASHLIKYGYK